MSDPLPARLRGRPTRPLTPPDAGTRTPIGPDTLNAALGAHMTDEHHGHIGRGCRTCRRYIEAVVAARARQAIT